MELHNLMEHEVKYAFDHLLSTGTKINCQCEQCKLDIIALSLNSLPPKYIVTERGHLYSKLSVFSQQFNTDVLTALTKAIEKVNKNPRHK